MTKLKVRQRGQVVRIDTRNSETLKKIVAMGVLPGMTVMLIQKYPSYVFQIGQSQFAVDQALAESICVRTVPLLVVPG